MTVSRSHRNPPNARLSTSHAGVNFWQFLVLSASRNDRRVPRRNTAQHRITRKAFLRGQADGGILFEIP